jgi:hypothetical protein
MGSLASVSRQVTDRLDILDVINFIREQSYLSSTDLALQNIGKHLPTLSVVGKFFSREKEHKR